MDCSMRVVSDVKDIIVELLACVSIENPDFQGIIGS
jgi:hypothetical protein